MPNEPPANILRRYLEDAIAAEANSEHQLKAMARPGTQVPAERLFAEHAVQTQRQKERLTARLNALGGSPSGFKGFLALAFNTPPKVAQMNHHNSERGTQNLIIGYAIENAEIAMYEALAAVAAEAGDLQTESLAREIESEEREMAQKIWHLIAPSARESYQAIAETDPRRLT